jgi:hypothetical protein
LALTRDASASVPPALVYSTIQAATRYAAIRAATTGAVISAQAVILCQGVLQTMLWTQLKTVAAVALVAGSLLATSATVAAVHAGKGQADDRPALGFDDQADRAQVVRSLSYDNYNPVPGETTILSILPANMKVKKGQLVCELDPARIMLQLASQQTKTQTAKAACSNAQSTFDVAEIAVKEYTEGILKQDLATVIGELKLAVSDLTRAIDKVEWADRMQAKGYVTDAQVAAQAVQLEKAVNAVEQAVNKRSVLQKYTKEKTTKELKSEVEKARADVLAKKATWELEQAKTKHLERDIAHCKIVAPADGELILAPGVEKGATVRERQLIFRVVTETRAEISR